MEEVHEDITELLAGMYAAAEPPEALAHVTSRSETHTTARVTTERAEGHDAPVRVHITAHTRTRHGSGHAATHVHSEVDIFPDGSIVAEQTLSEDDSAASDEETAQAHGEPLPAPAPAPVGDESPCDLTVVE